MAEQPMTEQPVTTGPWDQLDQATRDYIRDVQIGYLQARSEARRERWRRELIFQWLLYRPAGRLDHGR